MCVCVPYLNPAVVMGNKQSSYVSQGSVPVTQSMLAFYAHRESGSFGVF